MNLCRGPDITSEIRKGRLRWLGHVERMSQERPVKKVFKNIPEVFSLLESQERHGYMTLKMI